MSCSWPTRMAASRRASTFTSSARISKAQGWFKVVKKVEGKSWGGKLLGEHADWPAHEAAELPYLQAEEDRLLYVAATRARELLVVSRWTGNQTDHGVGRAERLPRRREGASGRAAWLRPRRVEPLDCSTEAQEAATDDSRRRARPRAPAVLVDHVRHRRGPPHRAHDPHGGRVG